LVSYPLDLTRRRLQVQGVKIKSLAPMQYKGMIDCLIKTYKYEGFFGYYKGMVPNLLKVVPAVSIYYASYEYIKGILNSGINID